MDHNAPADSPQPYVLAGCEMCGATTVLRPDNRAALCGECGLPLHPRYRPAL